MTKPAIKPATAVVFNWTNLRFVGLVGFEGEDLGIPGVVNRGNEVVVDLRLVGLVPADRGETCDAIDASGRRWNLPMSHGR